MSFEINYKGTSCRGTTFDYECDSCGDQTKQTHPSIDEPELVCEHCEGKLNKVILKAPAMDADMHSKMLSHNIGWDESGGIYEEE